MTMHAIVLSFSIDLLAQSPAIQYTTVVLLYTLNAVYATSRGETNILCCIQLAVCVSIQLYYNTSTLKP